MDLASGQLKTSRPFLSNFLHAVAHVQVSGLGESLRDWRLVAESALKHPRVLAAAPDHETGALQMAELQASLIAANSALQGMKISVVNESITCNAPVSVHLQPPAPLVFDSAPTPCSAHRQST